MGPWRGGPWKLGLGLGCRLGWWDRRDSRVRFAVDARGHQFFENLTGAGACFLGLGSMFLCIRAWLQEKFSAAARKQAENEAARAEAAAQESGVTSAEAKEAHQARLKQLRKMTGNSLLLSGILLHNLNFFSMRLIYSVGYLPWLEQAHKAKRKKTPQDDLEWMGTVAHGSGQEFLKNIWAHVVQNRAELARLGVSIDGAPAQSFKPEDDGFGGQLPGISAEEIPNRIMSFLLFFIEARIWSFAWLSESYPNAFAGLLSPDETQVASSLKKARETWEVCLFAERAGPEAPPALRQLREQIYFMSWPATQLRFRMLAHEEFHLSTGEQAETRGCCETF